MGATGGGAQPGLTFDAGFDADAIMMFTCGGGAPNTMYVNYALVLSAGGGSGGYVGQGNYSSVFTAHVHDPKPIGPTGSGWDVSAALNNTNVAGVAGGGGEASSGAGVTTGLEIKVSLAALDWDGTSPIKVCAFVTNGGHDYASNQVLGGLPRCCGNLGASFGGRRASAVDRGRPVLHRPPPSPVSITVDGDAEAAYGAGLAVQGISTGFGDHVGAPPPAGDCYGGAASTPPTARSSATRPPALLHVVLAGNLQSNFNKLDVFIDARAGAGQNSLLGNNPDLDFNGLNAGMGFDGTQPGLTFDAGFDADAVMFFTLGGGAPNTMYVDFGQLLTDGGGVGGYAGEGQWDAALGAHVLLPSNPNNFYGIAAALNNSNIAGVDGGDGQASSGAGVTTGLELTIPLAAIDWDGTRDIKVCAFVNSGGHSVDARTRCSGACRSAARPAHRRPEPRGDRRQSSSS
jgi:hypothetical protein